MKLLRKAGALLTSAVLLLSLAACSRENGEVSEGAVNLKVWGAQEDQEMLKEMVEDFKKANPNTTYNITFGVVGEKDTQTKLMA